MLFENLDTDTFIGQIIAKAYREIESMKRKNPEIHENNERKKILMGDLDAMLKSVKDIMYNY